MRPSRTKSSIRQVHVQLATVLAIVLVTGFVAQSAFAHPFDCQHNHCGLLTKQSPPDILVGQVEAVATTKQTLQVFHWARKHHYWHNVPADAHGYPAFVTLLSLSIPVFEHGQPKRRSVTVAMTREEYDSGPIKPGAVIRYAPHVFYGNNAAYRNARTHKDPVKEAYWWTLGCIAQLCAPNDNQCVARYHPGRFNWHTGAQLTLTTGAPMPNGIKIDTLTLLPKPPSQRLGQQTKYSN